VLSSLFRIFLLLAFPVSLLAQTANVNGVITDNAGNPVAKAEVKIKNTTLSVLTDSEGKFSIVNVPYGNHDFEISAETFVTVVISQNIKLPNQSLGKINLSRPEEMGKQEADNTSETGESETESGESSGQFISSTLTASRDAFTSASTFNFSIARFRTRGYDDDNFVTLINNTPMSDLITGRTPYYMWSGLNDVMRSREFSYGLAPASFSFGSAGGAYSINTRASAQRKQAQVSYALSDRVYDNRIMATWGTGISKKGWAGAFSLSHRWSNEGYIPGTFYDGTSVFVSAEKILNTAHAVSLTALTAQSKAGRAKSVIQEMYDLAGTHYYNPNWGWQNGEKRSAAINENQQPIIILSHEWNINDNSVLTSSASYRFGKSKRSDLSWFNAPDPRPDYYRNLPSWITATDSLQNTAENLFSGNEDVLQINWQKLYEANENNMATIDQANGISGSNVTGKRSLYILSNRVNDNSVFNLSTTYNEAVNNHLSFDGGLALQSQSTEFYQEVKDLLGGDFYVDLNKYADTSGTNAGNSSAIQNDLNHQNRILYKGDKFGYDYTAHISKTSAWMQTQFKYARTDFFFALEAAATSFYREGHYRNGIFKSDSYGDSETQNFFGGGFKTGITYKINGRNYLYANGAYISRAPNFEDAFFSANTRNAVVDNMKNETIETVEGGYILRAPKIKARLTGYLTQFNEGIKTEHFFLEGSNSTFVNFTSAGINKRHVGLEISADANIGRGISAAAAVSLGQYYYNSRPRVTTTTDNSDTTIFENEILYIENLRTSGSPQTAYSLGLNYRSPKFWFLNVSLNYFDNIYLNYGAARRTLSALDDIDKGSPLWNEILGQKKYGSDITLDASAGWSWKLNNKFKSLKKNTFIVLNLGITNITDKQDIISGGWEQPRFSANGMYTDTEKFPEKISYAFGRTFFASIILRMN
jgi:hypothetical protein